MCATAVRIGRSHVASGKRRGLALGEPGRRHRRLQAADQVEACAVGEAAAVPREGRAIGKARQGAQDHGRARRRFGDRGVHLVSSVATLPLSRRSAHGMMPAMAQAAALNEAGSGRRWAILALLFATRVALGLQFQTLGSVADPLAKSLGLSFTEIGTLIGLFLMPGLVLAIPLGFAGRYASDRALVTAGLVALALGGGVAAAADDFGLLALGRLLCGVGFVVTTILFTKIGVDWFAGPEPATAM